MLQNGTPVMADSILPPARSWTAVDRTASAPSWNEYAPLTFREP